MKWGMFLLSRNKLSIFITMVFKSLFVLRDLWAVQVYCVKLWIFKDDIMSRLWRICRSSYFIYEYNFFIYSIIFELYEIFLKYTIKRLDVVLYFFLCGFFLYQLHWTVDFFHKYIVIPLVSSKIKRWFCWFWLVNKNKLNSVFILMKRSEILIIIILKALF